MCKQRCDCEAYPHLQSASIHAYFFNTPYLIVAEGRYRGKTYGKNASRPFLKKNGEKSLTVIVIFYFLFKFQCAVFSAFFLTYTSKIICFPLSTTALGAGAPSFCSSSPSNPTKHGGFTSPFLRLIWCVHTDGWARGAHTKRTRQKAAHASQMLCSFYTPLTRTQPKPDARQKLSWA